MDANTHKNIGLTCAEASKLLSYFHCRPPVNMSNKPLAERAKLDKAIDFLDTIEDDNPEGEILF